MKTHTNNLEHNNAPKTAPNEIAVRPRRPKLIENVHGTTRCAILLFVAMVAARGNLPAQTLPSATVTPAVKVSWPTEDGGQYQVLTSSDLQGWVSAGPVVIGDGRDASSFYPADVPKSFYRIEVLPGTSPKWFAGLQELLTSSASVKGTGSTLEFSNLRLKSGAISFADMVNAKFTFDPVTQGFKLANYSVARNVGVYMEPYFSRDAATDFTLELGSTVARPNPPPTSAYTLKVSAEGARLSGNLTTGLAPVFWFKDLTGPLFLRIVEQPDGNTNETIIPESNQELVISPMPAVFSGKYVWEFMPVEGTSVSCQFRFHNANRTPIQTLVNGSRINLSLSASWEYAKYRIDLNSDQILSLTKPSDTKVRLTLVDEKSTKVSRFTGLGLNYHATKTGAYYLFIDNASGAASSKYSGTVSITN